MKPILLCLCLAVLGCPYANASVEDAVGVLFWGDASPSTRERLHSTIRSDPVAANTAVLRTLARPEMWNKIPEIRLWAVLESSSADLPGVVRVLDQYVVVLTDGLPNARRIEKPRDRGLLLATLHAELDKALARRTELVREKIPAESAEQANLSEKTADDVELKDAVYASLGAGPRWERGELLVSAKAVVANHIVLDELNQPGFVRWVHDYNAAYFTRFSKTDAKGAEEVLKKYLELVELAFKEVRSDQNRSPQSIASRIDWLESSRGRALRALAVLNGTETEPEAYKTIESKEVPPATSDSHSSPLPPASVSTHLAKRPTTPVVVSEPVVQTSRWPWYVGLATLLAAMCAFLITRSRR